MRQIGDVVNMKRIITSDNIIIAILGVVSYIIFSDFLSELLDQLDGETRAVLLVVILAIIAVYGIDE